MKAVVAENIYANVSCLEGNGHKSEFDYNDK
jgi:hypothetical protein